MKHKNIFFLSACAALVLAIILPGGFVFADVEVAHLGKMGLLFSGGPRSVSALLIMLMGFLSQAIIFTSVIGFMIGGGFFIFSAGDEGMMSRGKDIMIASVIGLTVTLLAYAIVHFVRTVFYTIG